VSELASADAVPEQVLQRVSEIIARAIGLHFPSERSADLQRGLVNAAAELGFESAGACASWLADAALTPAQLNTLANHLTIGETYFFRERKTFDVLESHVLPELIRARSADRRLRIWSAACSTGEEPYSLAILLQQLLPDWRDWRITLLATDINEKFLARAAEGTYGDWSFRDTPPDFRQRYFTCTPEGRYAILPEIRNLVTFIQLNLVHDGLPSLATDTNAMDLILCRNVLIYFTPQQASTLVEKLRRALTPDGWLAVSPSECSHILFSRYRTVNFPSTILYRKGESAEVANDTATGEWPRAAAIADPQQEQILSRAHFLAAGETAASISTPPLIAAPAPHNPAHPSPESLPPGEGLRGTEAEAAARARQLANEGRLTEALIESRRWIETEKLDPVAHYIHAMVAQELGDTATARISLQHTLYLDPAFVLAHFAQGNISRSEGRSAQATRHLRNALSLLDGIEPQTPLPQSDGLTAGRLTEIIGTILGLPRSAA
jgi:chemotaxis protein methyltransferase CheR